MMQATRVALVGIDGSGKSTLVRDLRSQTSEAGRLVTLHAPGYHQVSDAPLQGLSRHLDAASRLADKLGSFALKALVLYLQMTLYGPVERFLLDTYHPEWVISDRHPLVNSLVYGQLYGRLLGSGVRLDVWTDLLRERLDAESSGAYAALTGWIRVQQRRIGSAVSPRGVLCDVMSIFEQPVRSIVAELSVRYQARLPDRIFLIDVEPGEALRRSGCSRETGELHEKGKCLEQLQARYEEVLSYLGREWPEVVVHRVTNPDGDRAAALDAIRGHLSLITPRLNGEPVRAMPRSPLRG